MKRLLAAAIVLFSSSPLLAAPADTVLLNAKIYTVDARHRIVEALAARNGRIILVGSNSEAKALVGAKTQVIDGHGHLVLPGLVDAHIHPTGIVDLDVCSFESKGISLEKMASFIQGCIRRYHIAPGAWVSVAQWNFYTGNETSAASPTLRAALDRASTKNPIVLLGNDGHHAAYNSVALGLARNKSGKTVGFSGATLGKDFRHYAKLIGVDAQGEPNGTVNEEARSAIPSPSDTSVDIAALLKAPERMPQRLNSVGITAAQDAAVTPEMLAYYDALLESGKLTARLNLMQLFEPEEFRGKDGHIDYGRLLARATTARAKYAGNDLLRAEGVKIFADGVLEGNPYAVPPTLPDSPSLKPYLQPIFGRDRNGKLTVTGYVDLASTLCRDVRAHEDRYESADAVARFMRTHGYHPGQCTISSGKLQHDRAVILEYARRAHLAGFTLHIHAIGDAAVRTAIDAIELARAADGNTKTPDTIAHLQLVSPQDVARIGRDHLFLAYTYSWMDANVDYDMSVVPFFERVSGNSFAAFHNPNQYYERQTYPARSTKLAGGILAAGSDAPVETRDPQPFVNMQFGVTRALPGLPPLNARERLNIRDLIDAYTINGARAMAREREFGSLEPGKSADFIVVDTDILATGDGGHPERIGRTKVLQTWFKGQKVYSAKNW